MILHPLRLAAKDYEKLKCDSENVGLNKSDYLRKLINHQEIKPNTPTAAVNWHGKYQKLART